VARVVVCGYMVRYPLAGMLLAYLQYVLGLVRLGHEVLYFEESGWDRSCYNPVDNTSTDDPDYGLTNLRNILSSFGANPPVAYFSRQSERLYGLSWDELRDFFRHADLLLNIGGVCWTPDFLLCKRRALVDMDPFFTQIGRMGVEGFDHYDTYFSYGVNIGRPACSIPTRGIQWHPIVPPVVCDLWSNQGTPVDPSDGTRPFTTIANWSAYGGATYNGEQYGQKDVEFERMESLPGRVSQKLELALSGAGTDTVSRLRNAGWSIRNSLDVTLKLSDYQSYIADSRGEFSVAKNAYVKTRSGWFSDRTVCYLASGRPVVLQDSGFSDWLPTGKGVLAFRSVEEAAHCIDEVNANYATHAQEAKNIADSIFGHQHVLTALLRTTL